MDPKALIEYLCGMNNVYKSMEERNPGKGGKKLIVLDDMIDDMISNKKFYPVVTGLFIREMELNISLVFIKLSYFPVLKDDRLNTIHFLRKRNRHEI